MAGKQALLHEHHSPGLYKGGARFEAIQIHPRRKPGGIEPHRVFAAGQRRIVEQRSHLPAQHIEYAQRHPLRLRQLETNVGSRIERIRVVLRQGVRFRQFRFVFAGYGNVLATV